MQKTVLVTGGLGFIGSHTSVSLVQQGYRVVMLDNLANSRLEYFKQVQALLTPTEQANLTLVVGDVTSARDLDALFQQHKIDQVIHFAALKAVGESVAQPLRYTQNNVGGLITLLAQMAKHQVNDIIFSSSATVYGQAPLPLVESTPIGRASNPYGQSKITCEFLIEDACVSTPLRAVSLRYFNPVGAHPSGLIGEEYKKPFNIFPALYDVYLGKLPHLSVFGTDYPTTDGTAERDYIHIMDIVDGHIKALTFLDQNPTVKHEVINLGTGKAYSVKEIVNEFTKHSDRPIPVEYAPRRPGDLASVYANTDKAQQLLNFKAQYTLAQMCADAIAYLKHKVAKDN
ncbi:UDP-glucose 4-epimerase GalE [Psittacicella hinzii]|uniref:UDP-glucose 4-epimerase n=1 Tax=Psittacicella hinzii TaxID=2028575 RepID=A0A3A1Y2Z9_9GAMM|nr:UDP-glucose 4-epimerase GalE [Psittacicella hinzii]RIY31821.1 UDP-glucose 4-epimerase GalE [Psittacicella hinzii]